MAARTKKMWGDTTKRLTLAVGIAAFASCGDSPTIAPDPAVAPFVGTWEAAVFTVTADAPPNTVADILLSGSFSITIEPSGQYTATLLVAGFTDVEFGQLTVAGPTLTLQPDNGDPATSTYFFAGSDYFTLDGPTEFDYNLDGTPEAAQAHIELQRAP